MKKFLLCLLLTWLGIQVSMYAQQEISFPFVEDFEASDGNWTADEEHFWHFGTPEGPIISTAHSGQKAWYTKSPDVEAFWGHYLTSPVYSLSGRSNPTSSLLVSFYLNLSLEAPYEDCWVEYRTDQTEYWNVLGYVGSGENWYNTIAGTYYFGWENFTRPWTKVSHPLSVGSSSIIQFRIYYNADFNQGPQILEGVAIDDFSLQEIPAPHVSQSDSLALVALYNATDGPHWNSNNNWLVGNVDTWDGVLVYDGFVVRLDLNNNNLRGVLPKQFFNLKVLLLSLNNNHLTGPLPPEIGNLKSTHALYLNNNQFTGPLPKEIGNVSIVRNLDLSYNQFTGQIPSEITKLSFIWFLYLSHNQFSGKIPALWLLPQVGFIHVQNNKYVFPDLEALVDNLSTLPQLYYSPQDSVGELKTYVLNPGETLVLTAQAGSSSYNRYQWFKEGKAITPLTTSPNLTLSRVPADFKSYYNCKVTNSKVPDLTLCTRTNYIRVRSTNERLIYRVNAGGSPVSDSPLTWLEDTGPRPTYYLATTSQMLTEGGCWWPNHINLTGAPNCVFGSYRVAFSSMEYKFPVSAGKYRVNLYFAAKDAPSTVPGKTFNVFIEKKLVLSDFDIFSTAGYNALMKSYIVNVADNYINIELFKGKGNPQINGIEISSLSTTAVARTGEISDENESSLVYWPNPLTSEFLNIKLSNEKEKISKIEVSNQLGIKLAIVNSNDLQENSDYYTVSLAHLNLTQGVYMLKVFKNNSFNEIIRIVKK